MKKPGILGAALVAMINFNCGNNAETTQPASATLQSDSSAKPPDAHNSANSLDWQGTYKGVLPCADCEGIETSIKLDTNRTYILTTKYLGKPGAAKTSSGSFSWNKEGNIITLDGISSGPTQYFVGENNITQLDISGQKITGDLAAKYVLAKEIVVYEHASTSGTSLTDTHWKLIELMGKPIAPAKEGQKEMFILLKKEDNHVQGFAGCNSLAGTYELKGPTFISLKKLISTMMACPDMKTEGEFKNVLGMVDNYAIRGDTLSLNKARMAPLAKFVAVK